MHILGDAFAFSGMLTVSRCFEDTESAHEFVQRSAASWEVARTLEPGRDSSGLHTR